MARFDGFYSDWAPRVRSILRIVAAFLFLVHGTQKLFNAPPGQGVGPVPLMSLMGFAGILELVGGALLILGLATRPVAFVLAGEMAVAYFMAHLPSHFLPIVNRGEPAVLFCFIFLYLAVAGGGSWSVDRAIGWDRPGATI
jgi:putative oxidoreductase